MGTFKPKSIVRPPESTMQAFVELISLLLLIAAGMTLVTGSLNALFGWNLALKIGGSAIALPEEFIGVILAAIALVFLAALLYGVADLKRTFSFFKQYRWPCLGGLAVAIALVVIGFNQFSPNLALELAVQGGDTAKAEKLLAEKEYPVEVLNDLMYWSLKNEDMELTTTMLQKGADVNHQGGEFNTTLLHDAVLFFPGSAVEFLVANNADVNRQDDLGRTAIHHLITYREMNIEGADETQLLTLVETLVGAGADLQLADQNNKTPLELAEEKNYSTIADFLRSPGNE